MNSVKIFNTARLIICLFLIIGTQASARSFAQRLTLNKKNLSVEQFFEEVRKQCGYDFFYDTQLIRKGNTISINVNNATVEDALKSCLYDQPYTYLIKDKTVIIKENTPAISQGGWVLTGKVIDENKEPLIGVSVRIKNTNKGITTDANGKFLIDVDSPKDTLQLTYIGYITLNLNVGTKRFLLISLQPDQQAQKLNEVQVVGYGIQKKQSIVSAVGTIKGEALKFPTRSLSANLSGQVAGLFAIQRKGEPGYDNAEFWIRGVSTFAGGKSPLVLVDGIPRSINDIEPDEIESFNVLKDAAATAVYGAEGANGVVLITSKRGKAMKPVITFRTEHTAGSPQRLPKFVDAHQYLSLYNEALMNDGQSAVFSDELIEKYRNNADPDLYPNTNWIKTLLRKTTINHRYTLNVRGGSERAKYFVSGAYFSEGGAFVDDPANRYKTNIGVKRFNLRSNIDLDVSKTTKVSIDLAGQYLLMNYPGTGTQAIFRQMLITPSYLFPAIYSDGSIATFEKERGVNMRNPWNLLANSGYAKEWRSGIQSNVKLEQQLSFITQGLSYRGSASYDYIGDFSSRRNYNPSRFFATGRDEKGKLLFSRTYAGTEDLSDPTTGSSQTKSIYIEQSLNYNRNFNQHNVGGMLLYMQKERQLHDNALAFRKQGLVGRVTYTFGNRYNFEGNFGYTGSETFARGYRFGFFPAMGIGYTLSNEPFYPEVIKAYVSNLKLRFSVGRTGNDDTGGARFLYRPTFNFASGGFNQGITSGGGTNSYGNGIIEGRFEAPYLSWEIESAVNYGLNLGLLKDRIEIEVDYFNKKRSGILLQRKTIPGSAGFRAAPWENFGAVRNHGIDASIDISQRFNNFKLSGKGTFSFARNKVLEYDELPKPYHWMKVTGTRVNENEAYIADRLYTEDDFNVVKNTNGTSAYTLKESLPKPSLGGLLGPGDIKYVDLNGDGKIDDFDKKRGVGNPYDPEIIYGFGINIDFKCFYVSSFFQGTGKSDVLFGGATPEGWHPFAWGVDQSNFRTIALNRWNPSNTSQDVLMPRLHMHNTNNANNARPSTWWLRNGSFLRLKNMEVGYNLKKEVLNKVNLKSARLYVMGYNLALWDHIKAWDPETGNGNAGNSYPNSKTITLGFETTF